jgi:hypothetical protein
MQTKAPEWNRLVFDSRLTMNILRMCSRKFEIAIEPTGASHEKGYRSRRPGDVPVTSIKVRSELVEHFTDELENLKFFAESSLEPHPLRNCGRYKSLAILRDGIV